jgi:hypothetical protein
MKRTTQLTMALSSTLAISILAGPVAPAPPTNHESILERHHPLYDTVIPNPTDAPYWTSGELFGCFSCHAMDTSFGANEFLIEKDRRVCRQPGVQAVVVDIKPGSKRGGGKKGMTMAVPKRCKGKAMSKRQFGERC